MVRQCGKVVTIRNCNHLANSINWFAATFQSFRKLMTMSIATVKCMNMMIITLASVLYDSNYVAAEEYALLPGKHTQQETAVSGESENSLKRNAQDPGLRKAKA